MVLGVARYQLKDCPFQTLDSLVMFCQEISVEICFRSSGKSPSKGGGTALLPPASFFPLPGMGVSWPELRQPSCFKRGLGGEKQNGKKEAWCSDDLMRLPHVPWNAGFQTSSMGENPTFLLSDLYYIRWYLILTFSVVQDRTKTS